MSAYKKLHENNRTPLIKWVTILPLCESPTRSIITPYRRYHRSPPYPLLPAILSSILPLQPSTIHQPVWPLVATLPSIVSLSLSIRYSTEAYLSPGIWKGDRRLVYLPNNRCRTVKCFPSSTMLFPNWILPKPKFLFK